MAALATVVKVSLRKFRSTWYYTAHFAEGGSFGSNHCGTRAVALGKAAHGVVAGSTFLLEVNGKSLGYWTRKPTGELMAVCAA